VANRNYYFDFGGRKYQNMVFLKRMSPERELEIELLYRMIQAIIDLWEDNQVLKYHGRNL
jgi:hypothetical protein